LNKLPSPPDGRAAGLIWLGRSYSRVVYIVPLFRVLSFVFCVLCFVFRSSFVRLSCFVFRVCWFAGLLVGLRAAVSVECVAQGFGGSSARPGLLFAVFTVRHHRVLSGEPEQPASHQSTRRRRRKMKTKKKGYRQHINAQARECCKDQACRLSPRLSSLRVTRPAARPTTRKKNRINKNPETKKQKTKKK